MSQQQLLAGVKPRTYSLAKAKLEIHIIALLCQEIGLNNRFSVN